MMSPITSALEPVYTFHNPLPQDANNLILNVLDIDKYLIYKLP